MIMKYKRNRQVDQLAEEGQSNVFAILDLLPGFAYLQAPDYSIRFANRTFRNLFGEPAGRKCYQALQGADTPCKNCPTFEVFQTRSQKEWEWKSEQGRSYMVYDNLYTGLDVAPLILEVGIDITDRKKIENELRQGEERFKTVADFTYDWEYWLGNDGRLIYNSPSCERITGHRSADFIQNTDLLAEIAHPDDRAMMEKHLRDEIISNQVFSLDYKILTRDGEERWIGHACQPVFDSNGAPLGRRASNRDITERKQAEKALLHAERLAAMGRLIASLAHEINNPLQAMYNSMELVMDFPLPEEERQTYLKTTREEIERLMQITTGILDFTRPREIQLKPVQVGEALHQSLILANEQIYQAHVIVQLDIPQDLPIVQASLDQLTQVFLNLILNAVQQMPQGGKLSITARIESQQLKIAFADTGNGIPPDKLDLIFEPFYTTRKGGTGLGLAISQQIIEQHHGKILVENSATGGAIFTITLPVLVEINR
jgi:PAS domain S-box-containing protein